MKLILLVSLLGFSLVQEGVCTHLETCNCNEIAELVNTTVQQAAASLEYKLSLMVNSTVQQAAANLEHKLSLKISTTTTNINTTNDENFEVLKKDLTSVIKEFLIPIKTQLDYHLPLLPINNTERNPAKSCKTLYHDYPHATSGYYWIGTRGSPVRVYCNMNATCGNLTGGWMRVAYIDMRNTSHQCPSGLILFSRSSPPRRVCNIASGRYASTIFTVHGVEYSHVYGRIIAYQNRGPVGFHSHDVFGIDSTYVQGVSLTHGQSPRKHIWTFAGASDEISSSPTFKCPCINTNISPPPSVPDFVGNDYFCDTASSSHYSSIFYPSDPLWDGKGCGPTNTCCSFNNPPWFTKHLLSPTTDDVEMRLCAYYGNGNTPIELVELYVQ